MMTEVLQIYGYHQQTFHTISIDLSLQNLYFHLMVCLLFFVTWQNWSHEPIYSKTACTSQIAVCSFINGYVWLQYSPPLIPPRGEVNAADAFDIGSFDEEDTKGIKVQ